jgi:hypothetical protein
MTTAALLPTPGDPFLLKHWLVNYDRVWRGEVDELHVLVNSQPDKEVRDYIRSLVENVGGIYKEHVGIHIEHGQALERLEAECDTELVVLIEDDARVRLRGQFIERFDRIRRGETDVIGSPRGSMSTDLSVVCDTRWGAGQMRTADIGGGWGMWPCFVFARLSDLREHTNRIYGAVGWQAGEEVLGLHWKSTDDQAADTFGAAAFQLRDKLRVEDDVQYKGPWNWEWQLAQEHTIPWFHIGSLSSSYNLDASEAILADDRIHTDQQEILEWGHRVCWWYRFLRFAGNDLPDRQENYRRNLRRIQERLAIPDTAVMHWEPVIERLVCWDEA